MTLLRATSMLVVDLGVSLAVSLGREVFAVKLSRLGAFESKPPKPLIKLRILPRNLGSPVSSSRSAVIFLALAKVARAESRVSRKEVIVSGSLSSPDTLRRFAEVSAAFSANFCKLAINLPSFNKGLALANSDRASFEADAIPSRV